MDTPDNPTYYPGPPSRDSNPSTHAEGDPAEPARGGPPERFLRDRIPGYEVLEVLGRGGMGVVYKARQLSLKRIVALKMILSGAHASEDNLARFRSEAEAVAQLQHPNIVQIYEAGEHEGYPFFSLEFCGGGSRAGSDGDGRGRGRGSQPGRTNYPPTPREVSS